MPTPPFEANVIGTSGRQIPRGHCLGADGTRSARHPAGPCVLDINLTSSQLGQLGRSPNISLRFLSKFILRVNCRLAWSDSGFTFIVGTGGLIETKMDALIYDILLLLLHV